LRQFESCYLDHSKRESLEQNTVYSVTAVKKLKLQHSGKIILK